MYEHFYGLNEQPFNLTPDPDFLFINQNFREALDQITYAVNRREALTVLIGDVGTGKTTLCWALLMRMKKDVRTALILNPLLNIEDLLRAIIQDFRIKPSSRRAPWRAQISDEMGELEESSWLQELTRKQLVDELKRFLLESADTEVKNVLVIDEAQNLSVDCLEQLRILSNLETSKRKLLQIIFSGQLELDQKVNLPQLHQLKQRITIRCTLQPLSKDDMTQYIYHRIWKAGGSRNLTFSEGALNIIYKYSRGYPRVINIICDRTLMAGYNERAWNITSKMARTALTQLGMIREKRSWFPFYLPVRAVLITAASLMILAGLAYFVRPWSFFTSSVDRQQTTESAPAKVKSVPAKTKPLPAKVASVPAKVEPAPAKLASVPAKVESPPAEVKSVPAKTKPVPAKVASIPAKVESVPARVDSATAEISRPLTPPKNIQPTPKPIPLESQSSSTAFLLQVHSMNTQEQSDRAGADLRQKGYPVYQKTVTNSDNSRWYVVYVGPYDDTEAAQKAAATLLQSEGYHTILRSFTPQHK
jgi:general secretion pathway protein A